jgi:hypothetical protein
MTDSRREWTQAVTPIETLRMWQNPHRYASYAAAGTQPLVTTG